MRMKKIELTRGKFALVDDRDWEMLSKHKWYFMPIGYAARGVWDKETKKNYIVYMHRLIMGNPKGKCIDHINRDQLDNRRENLRICEHKENIRNGKLRSNNKSGHKGVFWDNTRQRWVGRITVNYKDIHLGSFKDKELAAMAYKTAAKKYFGDFA